MRKKLTSLFMTVCVLGGFTFAQAQDMPMNQQPAEPIEVSDEELEEFVEVHMGVAEMQQQLQMQYPQVLEEEGIEIETFQEIMQAEEMGAGRDDVDASEEELEAYDAAMEVIMEMEEELQEDVEEHVEEEGMEYERYEEIMMGIQQDPELMEQAQQLMQQMQGVPQNQQQQAPPQDPPH